MATGHRRSVTSGVGAGEGCEVTLFVGNRSAEVDPVDIAVRLGERVVVDERFSVAGEGHQRQNWRGFVAKLPAGRHELRIESRLGAARFRGAVDLEEGDRVVVTIAFWTKESAGSAARHGYFTVESAPPSTG